MRRLVAGALGNIKTESVEIIPALIRALEDDNANMRQGAVLTLLYMGPEATEAIPSLIQTLKSDVQWMREDACEALKAITTQDFGQDANAWQEWWEAQQ